MRRRRPLLSVEIRPPGRTPAGWCAGSGDTEAVRSVRHGPFGRPWPDGRGPPAHRCRRGHRATGTLRAVTSDPLLDPVPPTHDVTPTPGLWRNGAFVRLWTAATISVFGSFVTRIALPFVAILTLRAGPIEVAVLRSLDLIAALVVGFVAGAWVDRLRRRPVLIWADLGRAVLLGSIPVAAIGGWLTLLQVFVVSALAAVLTTFFDVADRAYLPDRRRSPGPRARQRRAGGDQLGDGVRRLRHRRVPRQPPDGADRDRHRRAVVRRVGRAARLDPASRAAPAARVGPRARARRDPRGASPGRPRPGPARARLGHDGPRGDVGRVRRDVAPVRDRRPAPRSRGHRGRGRPGRVRVAVRGAARGARRRAVRPRARSSSRRSCSPPSATC